MGGGQDTIQAISPLTCVARSSAVARLPFDGGRLLELLCESEPGAAVESKDPDHTFFWLIVADQFEVR